MGLKKKINKKVSKKKEDIFLLKEFDDAYRLALKEEMEFVKRISKQKPAGVF